MCRSVGELGLSWNKASDDSDVASELRYKTIKSERDNISTAENALINGRGDTDWTADANDGAISGLSPGTSYYFNVVVKDSQGNTAVYVSKLATTAE